MIRYPHLVLASADDQVLGAWNTWRDVEAAWGEQIAEHALAVAGTEPVTTGGRRYVGPALPRGVPVPEGWREPLHSSTGGEDRVHWIIPHLSTRAGRAAADRLATVAHGPSLYLPGLPMSHLDVVEHVLHHPSLLEDAPGHLTATWATASPELLAKVDPGLWEQVPLSVWHAAREAEEAHAQADDPDLFGTAS